MKEERTKSKKRIFYYLILAISVLLLVAATVLTVYFVSSGGNEVLEAPPPVDNPDVNKPNDNPDDPNLPSGGGEVHEFIAPVAYTSRSDFEDCYTFAGALGAIDLFHVGVHLYADNGTEVYAMADGVIKECISSEKLGSWLVIEHASGIEAVYKYIDFADGIKEGATVKQGQLLGTINCTEGEEHHDKPHLHVEMKNGSKFVDPTLYFEYEYEQK